MNDKANDLKDAMDSDAASQETDTKNYAAKEQPSPGQPIDGETMSASEQITVLKQECDELRDQALRARAEFVNYQKRAKQQAEADRAYAVGSLAKDLLDPIDNLDRAIDALRAKGAEGITAGLDMVQKQLHDIMSRYGVEPIPRTDIRSIPTSTRRFFSNPRMNTPKGPSSPR